MVAPIIPYNKNFFRREVAGGVEAVYIKDQISAAEENFDYTNTTSIYTFDETQENLQKIVDTYNRSVKENNIREPLTNFGLIIVRARRIEMTKMFRQLLDKLKENPNLKIVLTIDMHFVSQTEALVDEEFFGILKELKDTNRVTIQANAYGLSKDKNGSNLVQPALNYKDNFSHLCSPGLICSDGAHLTVFNADKMKQTYWPSDFGLDKFPDSALDNLAALSVQWLKSYLKSVDPQKYTDAYLNKLLDQIFKNGETGIFYKDIPLQELNKILYNGYSATAEIIKDLPQSGTHSIYICGGPNVEGCQNDYQENSARGFDHVSVFKFLLNKVKEIEENHGIGNEKRE